MSSLKLEMFKANAGANARAAGANASAGAMLTQYFDVIFLTF